MNNNHSFRQIVEDLSSLSGAYPEDSLYAVAMHLVANAKAGRVSMYANLCSIIASIYFHYYWLILIGLLFCVVAYVVIMQSHVRQVKKMTGLSEELQAEFSRQYKSDIVFAKEVDNALEIFMSNKRNRA